MLTYWLINSASYSYKQENFTNWKRPFLLTKCSLFKFVCSARARNWKLEMKKTTHENYNILSAVLCTMAKVYIRNVWSCCYREVRMYECKSTLQKLAEDLLLDYNSQVLMMLPLSCNVRTYITNCLQPTNQSVVYLHGNVAYKIIFKNMAWPDASSFL